MSNTVKPKIPKDCFSLVETAKRLGDFFGEDCTEAGIFGYALSGALRLSLRFTSPAIGYYGKEIDREVAIGMLDLPYEDRPKLIGDGRWVLFDHRFKRAIFPGIYDIPMLGSAKVEIEKRRNALLGQKVSVYQSTDPFFIYGGEMDEIILLDGSWENPSMPVETLFNDSTVVSPQAILNFEQASLKEQCGDTPPVRAEPETEKQLGKIERNTLLTIIAALCEDDGIVYKERGAAARIAELTHNIGAAVDEGTVKRHLDKIPAALESRKK